MRSLPNILTLSRILVIPALVAAFYLPGVWANWVAFVIFGYAALSDMLDGYFARAFDEQSRLGQFLDPIADKLVIASTILMMVAFERISGWTVLPALVILLREILVSGLREFLAELNVGMPVTRLAKWKTTMQVIALGFLLVGEAAPAFIPTVLVGVLLLWLAALLTLYTGYDYLRLGLRHIEDPAAQRAPRQSPETGAKGAARG